MAATDLTFAQTAVHDLDTLTVQTADTITFESTLDDIDTRPDGHDHPLRGDLTGIGGLTVAGTTASTASAAVATASLPEAVVLEADLELTASGSIDFNGSLSGDAGTESLTIVGVTDLTFAAAVPISPRSKYKPPTQSRSGPRSTVSRHST
ncbi:MAG: hypothetical protein R3C12_19370 [Planctomycetaceae bacterium]